VCFVYNIYIIGVTNVTVYYVFRYVPGRPTVPKAIRWKLNEIGRIENF